MNFKDPERYDLPTSKVVLFLKYAGEIFSFFFFFLHQIKFSPKKKIFLISIFPERIRERIVYKKNMVENRKIFSLLDKRAFVSVNFAKNSRGMLRKKKVFPLKLFIRSMRIYLQRNFMRKFIVAFVF